MDSFAAGNVDLIVDSGPVILNVTGCATLNGDGTDCATYLATAVDFSSSDVTNPSYNPLNLQIQFPGTGNIKLNGGAQSSGLVYAPNASVSLTGGSEWYGAIVGNTVSVSGGTNLHYDRNLQNSAYTIGPWLTQSFSWVKF